MTLVTFYQGNIFSVPVYFEVKSVNRSGVVDGVGTLVCNAWGDQPISIVWRKGSQQIYTNTDRSVLTRYQSQHVKLKTSSNRSNINLSGWGKL